MQLLRQADLLLQVLYAHSYSVINCEKNSGSHDGHTCFLGPFGIATMSAKRPQQDHDQEYQPNQS